MPIIKTKAGFCIDCDNRHGCKSRTPPCLVLMAEDGTTDQSGRQYLIERKQTDNCRDCPFLRSCWTEEEYDKAIKAV